MKIAFFCLLLLIPQACEAAPPDGNESGDPQSVQAPPTSESPDEEQETPPRCVDETHDHSSLATKAKVMSHVEDLEARMEDSFVEQRATRMSAEELLAAVKHAFPEAAERVQDEKEEQDTGEIEEERRFEPNYSSPACSSCHESECECSPPSESDPTSAENADQIPSLD